MVPEGAWRTSVREAWLRPAMRTQTSARGALAALPLAASPPPRFRVSATLGRRAPPGSWCAAPSSGLAYRIRSGRALASLSRPGEPPFWLALQGAPLNCPGVTHLHREIEAHRAHEQAATLHRQEQQQRLQTSLNSSAASLSTSSSAASLRSSDSPRRKKLLPICAAQY